MAPGIVLNPGTAVAAVEPLLGLVDLAVVMLVSPGHGGPKYTELAVDNCVEINQGVGCTNAP